MPDIAIRQVRGDEMLEVFYQLPTYAFMPSPPLPEKASYQERIKGRKGITYYALYENGKPVSCAASTPMTQHVRGKVYPMGGIFDVATHPEARRKGYSHRVLIRLLAAIREQGRSLSCLYPFNEVFYERLGYARFPQPWISKFVPDCLHLLVEKELGGHVEISPISRGYEAYRDFALSVLQRTHGMALFEHGDPGWAARDRLWLAEAKADGETVGVMIYQLRGDRIMDFTLTCRSFCYHTALGRYLLLAWIAKHIGQASRAEVWVSPYEHPELWAPDMKVALEPAFVAPMGRVLDVAGIGGMTVGTGGFSARISDPVCPWNEGAWRFESIDGRLETSRTDRADCELTIQALSALVYGAHDPDVFRFRGWGDPSPQAAEAMRRLFPPRVPYLFEQF